MKKRICAVTSSRADYGLMCWVMKEINKRPDLDLVAVVTGSHLSMKFGYTIKEVLNDGFKNLTRIKINERETSPYCIAKTISQYVNKFADFFYNEKIDFLVLLGDRFEMLAVALAALPFNIPIAHIGGGEITEGIIDDSIRHSLTKMSHLHFVITRECAERIRQMGEESWRVKVVGSPRLDFIRHVKFQTKEKLSKKFGLNFKDKVALVVYHPVTLELGKTAMQTDNLLTALAAVDIGFLMFYPNLEVDSDVIIRKIEKFARRSRRVKLVKPLKRDDYLSVLNAVDILIGNSSIGFVEAPSFRLPAVNIGNRQRGRDHVQNVINVSNDWQDIVRGIKKALYNKQFLELMNTIKNPYGDGKASERIVDVLSNIDLRTFKLMKKKCFD